MITLLVSEESRGETLHLECPASPEKLQQFEAALGRVDTTSPCTGFALVCQDVPNVSPFIQRAELTNEKGLETLNRLAEKLDGMGKRDAKIYAGALQSGAFNGLSELMDLTDSLGEYELMDGVDNETSLGKHLVEHGYKDVPPHIRPYLDFAAIGDDYLHERGGVFVGGSYVARRLDVPELAEKNTEHPVFRLHLTSPHWAEQSISLFRLELPASESWLEQVKARLGVDDFEVPDLLDVECLDPELAPLLPGNYSLTVEDFNRFAETVEQIRTGDDWNKCLAVLSVEEPEDWRSAYILTRALGDYELATDAQKDGVVQTNYGALRRLSSPFPTQEQGGMKLE